MNYRCERCKSFMADLAADLSCVGSFKPAVFSAVVPEPKESILCRCGYLNVFVEQSAIKIFQARGRKVG